MISIRHIIHPIKSIKSTFDWSTYVHFASGGWHCTAPSSEDCEKEWGICARCPWHVYEKPYEVSLRSFIWPYVLNAIRDLANRFVCRVKGHQLYDCSTAGPDSGNMDHTCNRCGRYWSVPLY